MKTQYVLFLITAPLLAVILDYGECSCHFDLKATDQVQNVTSPGYPGPFSKDDSCSWRIDASRHGKNVMVDFKYMSFVGTRFCDQGDMSIFLNPDNSSDNYPFCRNIGADKFLSESIYLEFRTNQAGDGFLFQYYESSACGGELRATSAENILESPGYPFGYKNHLRCTWDITAEHNYQTILVKFLDSKIDDTKSCDDKVTVGNKYGIPLGSFCGNYTPTVQSQFSTFEIRFSTNEAFTDRGFRLSYKAVNKTECNLTLPVDRHQMGLNSPFKIERYNLTLQPYQYNESFTCVWDLEKSQKNIDALVLLYGSTSTRTDHALVCPDERLVFSSENGSTVNYTCNDYKFHKFPPSKIEFTHNVSTWMYTTIYYKANTSQKDVAYPELKLGSYWAMPITVKPRSYRIFTIKAIYWKIKIDISRWHQDDYIKIFDGYTTWSSTPVITMYGRDGGFPTFWSSGPYLIVEVHTGSNVDNSTLRFTHTGKRSTECLNNHIYANGKTITSLNYPFFYPRGIDCSWIIESPSGAMNVTLNVALTEMAESPSCEEEYLEAFDGFDSTSRSLGKWCGKEQPSLTSTGRYMYLKFHGDPIHQGRFLINLLSNTNSGDVTRSLFMLICLVCVLHVLLDRNQ